jgi:diguanylate cyclase (GGDEF)-like protein
MTKAAAVTPPSSTDAPFVVFLDRLLTLMGSLAPDAEPKETAAFRAKLEEYRDVVTDDSRHLEVPRVTEACISTCEKYFNVSRKYYTTREAEFTEIVTILRDAAKVAIGASAEFNSQVAASSERFEKLALVEDLRDLKRRLVSEVGSLRHAVEEKQKRDDRAYAQLTTRVEVLQSRLTEVEEEASLDALTQIANRGRFQKTLAHMVDYARTHGTPLSLAMLDVDNFKAINDRHGHPIGDRVLICAARWLAKGIRQTDFVARYGGEEFAVLLGNATVSQVEERLKTLLENVGASSYEYELLGKKEQVRFTLSCGLADLQPEETAEDFVKRTDEALYEAKRRGKNRVVALKKSVFKRLLSRG